MVKTNKIVLSDDRLNVVCGNETKMFIEWGDVYRASFYKIDTITSILTYMVFDFENGEFIELHDEMENFDLLVKNLSKYLPIKYPDWENTLKSSAPDDDSVTVYQRE